MFVKFKKSKSLIKATATLLSLISVLTVSAGCTGTKNGKENAMTVVNLKEKQDEQRVLENPDKGWYIHYYDNGLDHYGASLAADDFLEDFPGMDHVYLRLAWSYLEPEEGKFDWEVIDKIIRPWTEKGYKISFRISCKETGEDQYYATPKWVRDAGAKGKDFKKGQWTDAWEPDYGDPIFLEKLENFHKAFAERYDNDPNVIYVDIGSYGDWGEGHTSFSSNRDWPISVIKKHIDIYTKYYKHTQLVISDDFVGNRGEEYEKQDLLNYILKNNLTIRDDSVCVKWYADNYGYDTLRSPELFDAVYKKFPTVLELEHYTSTIKNNTWKKGKPFLAAVERAHATYAGFHGDARQWLSDNAEMAKVIYNKMGYWYFVDAVSYDKEIKSNEFAVKLSMNNKGAAPAYKDYKISFKLTDKSGKEYLCNLDSSENTKWPSGKVTEQQYNLKFDSKLKSGEYKLSVRMSDDSDREIELGFEEKCRDDKGYYELCNLKIENNSK